MLDSLVFFGQRRSSSVSDIDQSNKRRENENNGTSSRSTQIIWLVVKRSIEGQD